MSVGLEINRDKPATFIVRVDRLFEDLTEPFLEHRREDVAFIRRSIRDGHFDEIRELGHEIKGTASVFGFPDMGKIGQAIEGAARQRRPNFLISLAAELEDYLDRVQVVFV